MLKFCAYVHLKPDLTPFYVGKGTLNRARTLARSARSIWHQRVVEKYGRENIVIKTIMCASEDEAFFIETSLISLLREQGVVLCNKTDGGEGIVGHTHSAETKKKLRDNHKHTPASAYQKAVTRATHCGKTVSPETRLKMSNAMKLRMNTPEIKEAIRLKNLGKKRSPSTCAKFREIQRARVISEEDRLQMGLRPLI